MGFIKDAANTVLGGGLGLILGEYNDRRQIKQQQKLTDMQIAGQKQMADYSQAQQFDMWNKTNYAAQVEHMKKAGLNPGLMYGMGGGGGATTGSASGSVSGGSAPTGGGEVGMGMQMALLQAQKENIEADTANKKAGAAATTEATIGTKFQNELNQKIGISEMWAKWGAEKDRLTTATEKEMADWEAEKAAGFQSGRTDDPNSNIAKAKRAGYQKAEQELQNAIKQGDLLEAEKAIKGFEARMSEQGFGANSPWYLKLVTDLFQKYGMGIGGKK